MGVAFKLDKLIRATKEADRHFHSILEEYLENYRQILQGLVECLNEVNSEKYPKLAELIKSVYDVVRERVSLIEKLLALTKPV